MDLMGEQWQRVVMVHLQPPLSHVLGPEPLTSTLAASQELVPLLPQLLPGLLFTGGRPTILRLSIALNAICPCQSMRPRFRMALPAGHNAMLCLGRQAVLAAAGVSHHSACGPGP